MGKWKNHSVYALYHGDTFMDIGTIDYLSKKFNMTAKLLHFYHSPAYYKKMDGTSYILINVGKDDDYDSELS